MSRFTQRAALVAGLALVALGPARADTPRAPGLGCAGAPAVVERCRHARIAHRRVRAYRVPVAEYRPRDVEPLIYAAGRYASLLILGVGF